MRYINLLPFVEPHLCMRRLGARPTQVAENPWQVRNYCEQIHWSKTDI